MIRIFIFAILFSIFSLYNYAQENPLPENIRQRIGVTQLKKLYPNLNGNGIKVLVYGEFKPAVPEEKTTILKTGVKPHTIRENPNLDILGKEGEQKEKTVVLGHSDQVRASVQWIAPKVELFRENKKREKYDVVNISGTLRLDEAKKLAKNGSILVYAAHNDASLIGQKSSQGYDRSGNYIYTVAKEINDNPNEYPGYVLIIGSALGATKNKDAGLSVYSTMAGIARDAYLFLRSSGTIDISEMRGIPLEDYDENLGNIHLSYRSTLQNKKTPGLFLNFERYEGTSFAAPAVCGIVALLLQAFPSVPPREIAKLLLKTAQLDFKAIPAIAQRRIYNLTDLSEDKIKQLLPVDVYGNGEVNLEKAFNEGLRLWGDKIKKDNNWIKKGNWPLRSHTKEDSSFEKIKLEALDSKNDELIKSSHHYESLININKTLERGLNFQYALVPLARGALFPTVKSKYYENFFSPYISQWIEAQMKKNPDERSYVTTFDVLLGYFNLLKEANGQDQNVINYYNRILDKVCHTEKCAIGQLLGVLLHMVPFELNKKKISEDLQNQFLKLIKEYLETYPISNKPSTSEHLLQRIKLFPHTLIDLTIDTIKKTKSSWYHREENEKNTQVLCEWILEVKEQTCSELFD